MSAPPLVERRDVAYLVILEGAVEREGWTAETVIEVAGDFTLADRLALSRAADGSFVASFGNGDRAPVTLAREIPRTLSSPDLKLLFWHGAPSDSRFRAALAAAGVSRRQD